MRKIKFRLRDEDNKIVGYERWYTGHKENGEWRAFPIWLYSDNGEYWNPDFINHKYKDQYTGLKDKNGKEIYEGDILGLYATTFIVKFGLYDNGETWEDNDSGNGFYVDNLKGWIMNLMSVGEYEIIGNIYENPELISESTGTDKVV